MNEAVHLCWSDVDFAADTIRVSAKKETPTTLEWSPKDKELRKIPVPSATTALLARLQATCPEGYAYVFLPKKRFVVLKAVHVMDKGREGKSVLNNFPRQFRALVVAASKKARTLITSEGKPAISLHDLRRTCITNWSRVVNIKTVMRLAGHSSERTTLTYYAGVTVDQVELARSAAAAALGSRQGGQTDPKLTPTSASETGSPT